jgi:hypothetical protein
MLGHYFCPSKVQMQRHPLPSHKLLDPLLGCDIILLHSHLHRLTLQRGTPEVLFQYERKLEMQAFLNFFIPSYFQPGAAKC